MEIDANMNLGSVEGYTPAKRTVPAPTLPTTSGPDTFTGSNALQGAGAGVPDVRAEAVARGKALVADSGYPSGQTLSTLANFLANKLTNSGQ